MVGCFYFDFPKKSVTLSGVYFITIGFMIYDHKNIDKKWQKYWEDNKTFEITDLESKPKYYVLDMFPYPSGAGLHVGHPRGQIATDIMARLRRMQGFNVLHPMGWDAFGLPAENYAIKHGVHPAETIKTNSKYYKKQIQLLGFSYDWSREMTTTHPDYYRWTQWIFLQLYKKGLAYEKTMSMNWCPTCKTVAANEEVSNGVHERCERPVEKRDMTQWFLRITAYADRLLSDLEGLDWSDSIISMQKNWIGKSEGAELDFAIDGHDEGLRVYTTRPDTLFGATYMVLAPEHVAVDKITTLDQKSAVESYVNAAKCKSERERKIDEKTKTGIFTGAYAMNPVNNKKIPIWVADYVLMGYGTGAIMAVPAHDERDHDFAKKFDLEIIPVIEAKEKTDAVVMEGTMINSGFLDGSNSKEARVKMIEWLEEKKIGDKTTNYRLRDWVFTRQRYWGEPIPLIHAEDGSIYTLSESQLPLRLPEVANFEPTGTGESPLAQNTDWVNVSFYLDDNNDAVVLFDDERAPEGKSILSGKRETSTMPNWAGSSWYWIRFADPRNTESLIDKKIEKYWNNVDLYVGGAEHAVLHLLYARFWQKFLYDINVVSEKEPFKKLVNQGMLQSYSYKNDLEKYYHPDDTEEKDGKFYAKDDGRELFRQIEKISKSKLNVINPDDIVYEFGADSLRLYEMFMGPFDQSIVWEESGISGIRRFLEKIYKCADTVQDVENKDLEKILHKTIKKVLADTEDFKFNTAISAFMVFMNACHSADTIPIKVWTEFVKLLSPYAPHTGQELWEKLGRSEELSYVAVPEYSEKMCQDDELKIMIQVNGKVRGHILVALDASKESILQEAKSHDNVQSYVADGTKKEIYVPGKLVSLVV